MICSICITRQATLEVVWLERHLTLYLCVTRQITPYAVWSERRRAAQMSAGGWGRHEGSPNSRPLQGTAATNVGTKRKRYTRTVLCDSVSLGKFWWSSNMLVSTGCARVGSLLVMTP